MMERAEIRGAERHLKGCDPVMAGIVKRVGRCRIDEVQRDSSFEALARTIVFQQLSGKAANTIYGRLLKTLGKRRPNPESILRATDDQLRSAGISRQKMRYLRDLSEKIKTGQLSLRRLPYLDDEGAIEELIQVVGIGRWTAGVYLIFRLGRFDVLPVDDLGLRDSARLEYGLEGLPDAKTLLGIGEPWRPYRSIGSWYLWLARHPDALPGEE